MVIHTVEAKGFDEDFIWMAAMALWERLAPDVPNVERIDEKMQEGYALLEERKEKYGPLKGEDPLFHSDWNHWNREERTRRRLTRRSVQRVVKKTPKRAGMEEWEDFCPTSLRKA